MAVSPTEDTSRNEAVRLAKSKIDLLRKDDEDCNISPGSTGSTSSSSFIHSDRRASFRSLSSVPSLSSIQEDEEKEEVVAYNVPKRASGRCISWLGRSTSSIGSDVSESDSLSGIKERVTKFGKFFHPAFIVKKERKKSLRRSTSLPEVVNRRRSSSSRGESPRLRRPSGSDPFVYRQQLMADNFIQGENQFVSTQQKAHEHARERYERGQYSAIVVEESDSDCDVLSELEIDGRVTVQHSGLCVEYKIGSLNHKC